MVAFFSDDADVGEGVVERANGRHLYGIQEDAAPARNGSKRS